RYDTGSRPLVPTLRVGTRGGARTQSRKTPSRKSVPNGANVWGGPNELTSTVPPPVIRPANVKVVTTCGRIETSGCSTPNEGVLRVTEPTSTPPVYPGSNANRSFTRKRKALAGGDGTRASGLPVTKVRMWAPPPGPAPVIRAP